MVAKTENKEINVQGINIDSFNQVNKEEKLNEEKGLNKEKTLNQEIRISLTQITMWKERWFLSSNAKDIGTLYLMFALFSGLIGTAFSVLIRLELSGPGVQYIADNQLYNSIITAHAIVMIFFMVNKNFIFNFKSQFSFNDNNNNIIIGNHNYDYKDFKYSLREQGSESKFKYVKILVNDPFNNRDIILKVTKKQKGIYVWESLDGKHLYVGHSINLYNRISFYFMPSILKTKPRKVLRYLNKYGFSNMKLTVYIMDDKSSLEQVVGLEQQFIDSLKPNLNVDLVASSYGYPEPMNQEMRDKLCKETGRSIYVYSAKDFTLLYAFKSKQHLYNTINIHHNTLNDCITLGTLYLDTFSFL